MKVVDAGVVVDLLVGALDYDRLGGDELAVPHLLDSEVLNALRSRVCSEPPSAQHPEHGDGHEQQPLQPAESKRSARVQRRRVVRAAVVDGCVVA